MEKEENLRRKGNKKRIAMKENERMSRKGIGIDHSCSVQRQAKSEEISKIGYYNKRKKKRKKET